MRFWRTNEQKQCIEWKTSISLFYLFDILILHMNSDAKSVLSWNQDNETGNCCVLFKGEHLEQKENKAHYEFDCLCSYFKVSKSFDAGFHMDQSYLTISHLIFLPFSVTTDHKDEKCCEIFTMFFTDLLII
jgi:hypothetical protein